MTTSTRVQLFLIVGAGAAIVKGTPPDWQPTAVTVLVLAVILTVLGNGQREG